MRELAEIDFENRFSLATDGPCLIALGQRSLYIGVGTWGCLKHETAPGPDRTVVTIVTLVSPEAAANLHQRLRDLGLNATKPLTEKALIDLAHSAKALVVAPLAGGTRGIPAADFVELGDEPLLVSVVTKTPREGSRKCACGTTLVKKPGRGRWPVKCPTCKGVGA